MLSPRQAPCLTILLSSRRHTTCSPRPRKSAPGFPYFAHHDSASALWKQKWRTACAHGIYPFTDAKVEDFNPMIAELVRLSGDRMSILYRSDDYAQPFFPAAEKLVAAAAQAEERGDTAQAHDLTCAWRPSTVSGVFPSTVRLWTRKRGSVAKPLTARVGST